MDCPYCDFSGNRDSVHAHLGETHGEHVSVRVDEAKDRRYYGIVCPVCDAPWEAEIKPRGRDPNFLTEFDREIKLVAFDMLLRHIEGEHMTGANAMPATQPAD
jgi:hypothetical protein